MRVRDPHRLLLGLLFIAFAAPAFVIAGRYAIGTATDMGPGYFPRLISACLFAVGALVVLQSLYIEGAAIDWRPSLRPVALILSAVLIYTWTLRTLGAAMAVALLIGIASLASRESRWLETLISALVLGVLCALVFVKGLGMQAPIWPWDGH